VPMPRQARLDAPGTLHHVMIHGIEGIKIFKNDKDRDDFISHIRELVKKTNTRVLAWVLMENHVHFLLISGHPGLSPFMRSLLTGYAVRFNRKYKRSGHLFQNRYKSIVCEEEPYLLELVRYIHLNPLRAMVVSSIEELNRYRWSGHSNLIGRRKNDWQEREYVLKYFSEDKKKSVRSYRRFIKEGKDQGVRSELVGGGLVRSAGGWSQVLSFREKKTNVEYDSRILGGGDFVANILREADAKLKRQLKDRKKGGSVDKVIKTMCKKDGITEQELQYGSKRRKVSKVRAKISCHLSQKGVTMAEIARHVGVSTSAIAKAIKNQEIVNDNNF